MKEEDRKDEVIKVNEEERSSEEEVIRMMMMRTDPSVQFLVNMQTTDKFNADEQLRIG